MACSYFFLAMSENNELNVIECEIVNAGEISYPLSA